MNVIEKNCGQKIPYDYNSKTITFDDDLSINLLKRERDYDEHIDICYDEDRNLVIGAAAGRSYVAEIDIPARRYYSVEGEDGEELRPEPFDIELVTLTLWAVDNYVEVVYE